MGAEEPLGQVGSAISMYVSLPEGGGGQLRVDPDGVQTLIDHLEQALVKLSEIYEHSSSLMNVSPPGFDPFSPIAVEDIKRTAGDEPGGHHYANKKAQDVFQQVIDNLRDSLAAYRATESHNAQNFRGDG